MNKEKIEINAEDVDLLKEMKNNCLNSDVYDDEKRLLKSNAITKFLNLQKEYETLKKDYNNELDDNFKLSEVWLKSQEENKRLKFYLNDVIFSEFNDDVELAARYLRRLNYIDFDEENQLYINKHNEEPFFRPNAREKHFIIDDDKIDDYVKQIENEALMLKRIVKEAIDYINTAQYSDVSGLHKYSILEFWFVKEILGILERADK